jgi:hypothetical protein
MVSVIRNLYKSGASTTSADSGTVGSRTNREGIMHFRNNASPGAGNSHLRCITNVVNDRCSPLSGENMTSFQFVLKLIAQCHELVNLRYDPHLLR